MNVSCRRSKARGSVDSEEANNGIALLLYFDSLTHKESMYAMRPATSADSGEWSCEVVFLKF